jgi:FixJ family two-component response regulator
MFTIFLVDSDPVVLRRLARQLRATGHDVQSFASAGAFLKRHDASISGCVIAEVAMPNLDGLKLQRAMIRAGSRRPIIFLAASSDIPTCVRAMKAGAVDFLIKPVKEQSLFAAVKLARRRDSEARRTSSDLKSINARFAKLTRRQSEVMVQVISGKINRQIAQDLGTVVKTIKAHRGQVMKKLNVRSVADLVRLAERAGISRSGL